MFNPELLLISLSKTLFKFKFRELLIPMHRYPFFHVFDFGAWPDPDPCTLSLCCTCISLTLLYWLQVSSQVSRATSQMWPSAAILGKADWQNPWVLLVGRHGLWYFCCHRNTGGESGGDRYGSAASLSELTSLDIWSPERDVKNSQIQTAASGYCSYSHNTVDDWDVTIL